MIFLYYLMRIGKKGTWPSLRMFADQNLHVWLFNIYIETRTFWIQIAKGQCLPWLKVSPNWLVLAPISFSAMRLILTISFKDCKLICETFQERQSQQKVDTMKQFFHLMSKKFTWAKLPLESHHPEFRSEDIQIFKFQTKKMEEIESWEL